MDTPVFTLTNAEFSQLLYMSDIFKFLTFHAFVPWGMKRPSGGREEDHRGTTLWINFVI